MFPLACRGRAVLSRLGIGFGCPRVVDTVFVRVGLGFDGTAGRRRMIRGAPFRFGVWLM